MAKQRKGFAVMDKARQREIASLGGKAAHAQGTGHEWTKEEAVRAGALGGAVSRGGRGKLQQGEVEVRLPALVRPFPGRNTPDTER